MTATVEGIWSHHAIWWRVEFDESGELQCVVTDDQRGVNTETVLWVLAYNQHSAVETAEKLRQVRTHLEAIEAIEEPGQPPPGATPAQPKRAPDERTQKRLEYAREYNRDYRKRQREQEQVAKRAATLAEEADAESEAARLKVLKEVQDRWIGSTNNKLFSDWLRDEINAAWRKANKR